MTEEEFIERVLTDQPVPPRYFAVMKRLNSGNEVSAETHNNAQRLGFRELDTASGDTVLIDTRTAERFAEGHIPGSLNIPFNKSFLNWCGSLVPYDVDVYLLSDAESDDAVGQMISELGKIGITRVRGFFGAEILRDWKSRRCALDKVPQVEAGELQTVAAGKNVQVVDVRAADEWRKGHLPGAIHIPLAALPDRMSEIDPAIPVVLHCKGGGRSAIATSFLIARGMKQVSNLRGGYESWQTNGFDVVTEPALAESPVESG
jgi:hydroxyacylglutathione hydrolase